MAIHLYKEDTHTTTSVSNTFIDQLMPEANGEFVKIYLYLLRSLSLPEQECTISRIADALNDTEADVMRGLRYWERMHLLSLDVEGSEICGIHFLEIQGSEAESPGSKDSILVGDLADKIPQLPDFHQPVTRPRMDKSVPVQPTKEEAHNPGSVARTIAKTNIVVTKNPPATTHKDYSPDEITRFMDDDSVSQLFSVIETYLKKQLSATDVNMILFWLDHLHFPKDLIIYLVEYCISKGHKSLRYMDRVAQSWNENHITTVEQAKEDSSHHSNIYYGIQKAFGISGRSLVDVETSLIDKWTKEYAFDLSIVLEACQRTMTAIHQPSFEYADKILSKWHQNHVHTLADIEVLDSDYNSSKKQRRTPVQKNTKKNSFTNFEQREYDYDELEQMLLNTSV